MYQTLLPMVKKMFCSWVIHVSRQCDVTTLVIDNKYSEQFSTGTVPCTDCILDVHITDTDAKTYQAKDPMKVLASYEKNNKKKYLAPCLAPMFHFTPFIVSADGFLVHEADAVICQVAGKYAKKTEKPYSVICDFMHNCISIAILCATNCCLQGSHILSGCMSSPHPQWLDGAGLGLYPQ